MIILNVEETCPADIILLDSSYIQNKESICFIDTHLITGAVDVQLRKACFLTKSNKSSLQSNPPALQLSLKLEYHQPNPQMNSFVGYLKRLRDPKIERLSNDNFIPQGSIVKKAKWIIGMVVYIGKDTKIMQNTRFNFHKSSFLEKYSQIYFIAVASLVLICAFVRFYLNFLF